MAGVLSKCLSAVVAVPYKFLNSDNKGVAGFVKLLVFLCEMNPEN